MYHTVEQVISKIKEATIPNERKSDLQMLIDYVQSKKDSNQEILLNFICTHNSRRSQFSQIWAYVAASYYNINIGSYSGGVEVTAFNERAVASLERFGFKISSEGITNPIYNVSFDSETKPLKMFSKLYDDDSNPKENFAAVMTCAHADENCPFVAGCDKRIPVRYNDPKEFDDTPLEKSMYDYRSYEIANEMFYVFSKIK